MLRVLYNHPFTDTMVIDDKEKCHHLSVVLRCKPGDTVYLVNETSVAETKITSIAKDQVCVSLVSETLENNELPSKITLGFGPLKGDNTQLVVQKAVELGAAKIDLINFKRNISKFDSTKAVKKLAKFEKIIEGACLQSRRNIVPQIAANINLDNDYLAQFDLVLVGYENEQANHILSHSQQICEASSILVLIGPEGGIDQSEIDILEQANNVKIITLGARILRAETASICSLSVISSILEGK